MESLAKSLPQAKLTVAAVLLVIALIVLVSPVTRISSPIDSSDRNAVPEPGTVVFVPVGSIVPVSVNVAPSVNLIYNPYPFVALLNFILSYTKVAPIGSSTPFKR